MIIKYDLNTQNKIEDAIELLVTRFSDARELKKPVLLHSIRVGTRLYFENYSPNIVISGYLHDIVEDTDISIASIKERFNDNIANIVAANTKNADILDNHERHEELIKKCLNSGIDAMIVKAADILDNYTFYVDTDDHKGIDYCKENVSLFKKYIDHKIHKDPIIEELFLTVK